MQKIKLKQIQFDGSPTQYVKGDGTLGNANELVGSSFTFVLNINNQEEITCDTTISDIIDAFENNKIINAKLIENASSFASYNIDIVGTTVITTFNISLFGHLVYILVEGVYSNNTDVWSIIGYFTTLNANDKEKLDSIEANAKPNVQSDWNQTDDSADVNNKISIILL